MPLEYSMAKNPLSKLKSELLNPNHSHFLLVDDSRANIFGGEIEFRSKLENEISKGNPISKRPPCPVVTVVIEGGPNTVKTVLKSVENNIQCVLIYLISSLF